MDVPGLVFVVAMLLSIILLYFLWSCVAFMSSSANIPYHNEILSREGIYSYSSEVWTIPRVHLSGQNGLSVSLSTTPPNNDPPSYDPPPSYEQCFKPETIQHL